MRTLLAIGFGGAFLLWFMKKKKTALCRMDETHSGTVTGTINLIAKGKQTLAICDLSGLTPGLHGFHVHECGDFSNGCASTCNHYNPDGKTHGGPLGPDRHRGDFGNITVDERGHCTDQILADVTLDELIGRAFIIHADKDDLGLGNDEESKKTGNAGARIACGKIV